jgi:hypothetical protein
LRHPQSTIATATSQLLLGLSAVLHLYLGAVFAIDPTEWLANLSLAATAPAGLAEMRAFYGGLMLAMGALFAWCAGHRASLRPGLVFMTVTYFGAATVRTIAVVDYGVSDELLWRILAVEALGAVSGALCLWRLRR